MKKAWIAVVLSALLVGTLVGVVWARPNDTPRAADITRKITLAPADFNPTSNGSNYYNAGPYVYCVTASCTFEAPIVFPTLGAVTVERIRLHVSDSNVSAYADTEVCRANPSTGTIVCFGGAKSPTGESGGFQTYTSSDIKKVVWPSQRALIGLVIYGPSINVYGVTVEYHRNI